MAVQEIISAGFGGQGILSIGELLAYAGMHEGKHVSLLPSYGPEMRGGTSNCQVILSDKPIASPIVVDASSIIIMNLPSLLKFEAALVEDGLLFINSSLVKEKPIRDDVRSYFVPANEIARALGDDRVANMVMLGAFVEITHAVKSASLVAALANVFGPRQDNLFLRDREALEKGADCVRG